MTEKNARERGSDITKRDKESGGKCGTDVIKTYSKKEREKERLLG